VDIGFQKIFEGPTVLLLQDFFPEKNFFFLGFIFGGIFASMGCILCGKMSDVFGPSGP